MSAGDIRLVVRQNVRALLAAGKAGKRQGPSGVLDLEADSGIGKSTIYRLLDAKENEAIGLDTLAALANGLRIPAWALLVPSLDVLTPTIIVSEGQLETLVDHRVGIIVEEMLHERHRLRQKASAGKSGVGNPSATSKAPTQGPKRPSLRKSKAT